jgi:hypothetical protein
MRIAMVTAILLVSPVHAADFRALDFGTPCDSIGALEKAQNSVPIPWTHSEEEGWHAFRGRAFDREVSILYLCVNGHLCTGNYYFPLESFDGALKSLRFAYDSLNSTHGAPFLDNTPWQKDADPRFVSPDPQRYMVTWQSSRVRTTIAVMPGPDNSDSTWHVFVVVAQNKS